MNKISSKESPQDKSSPSSRKEDTFLETKYKDDESF